MCSFRLPRFFLPALLVFSLSAIASEKQITPATAIVVSKATPKLAPLQFVYAIPNLAGKAVDVPVNLPLDLVYWVNTKEGVLIKPLVTVFNSNNEKVAVKVIAQHQWWRKNPPYLKNIVPRTLELRLAPESGAWSPDQIYTVYSDQRKIGDFVVGHAVRGDLISKIACKGEFPPFADKSVYSKAEMDNLGEVASDFYLKGKHSAMPAWVVYLLLHSALPNVIVDNAKTGVALWKVSYESIDPFGNAAILTGLLLEPTDMAAQHLVVYLHSASSGPPPSQPTAGMFSILKMAALGNTVIAPDNYGLKAGPGHAPQPYMWSVPTAVGVNDMMTALASQGIKIDPTVLVGGSQGASSALATLNWFNDEGKTATLYAGEGAYGLEDIFQSYAALVAGVANEHDPWLKLIKENPGMLSIYLRSILAETNYYGLTSIPLNEAFDVKGKMTKKFAKAYLNGDYPQVEIFFGANTFLHQTPAGFKGEATLWHLQEDALLPVQSTTLLRQDWQRVGDVSQKGDCREDALVTKAMLWLSSWKRQPMISHILCGLYLTDDLVKKYGQ